MKKINGTVVYQNLGTGFWGIEDNSGGQWRPINMPEQLKYVGKKINVTIQVLPEGMSMFMWGTPVKIMGFSTMMP